MEKSYAAAVAQTAPECVICDHPERDIIEAHRNQGAPFMVIARTLKTIGSIGGEVSVRSAAGRVAIHFRGHAPDPGWGV